MPAPSAPSPYAYCLLRLVPDLDRGEALNVGLVLFCRQQRYLGLRGEVDPGRLGVLRGTEDDGTWARVEAHLAGLVRVAAGDAGAGPIAALDASERFGWLAAPASTILQPGPVHTGLCADAARTLDELFARLVAG